MLECMQHLLLRVAEDVILDMEAGLEHMGRASATGVDAKRVESLLKQYQLDSLDDLLEEIGLGRLP